MPEIPKIDIRPDHWEIVRDILQKHVPQYSVWAFGSRAKWTAKEYSDLDLAIITDQPLSLDISAGLSDDFSESDLPWKVDVVDWATTSESFRKVIERDKVVVQEAGRGLDNASDDPLVRLGDHVEACLGKMLDAQKNRGVFQPYLGNSNVRWGAFDLQDLAVMRFEQHEEERYGLRDGDLVVCEGGEPGRCAVWQGEVPNMRIQKALHRIRVKDGLDNYFLYYWFLQAGKTGALEPYFTGTTIKHLTGKALAELQIPLPPIERQRGLVKVLRSLDDKIDLNRRINQTLEAMAQAIFKSWFVDFDPVKAKITAIEQGEDPLRAAMRAISGKTDAELDQIPREHHDQLAATAALFPDEMKESALGEIPKGWTIKSVSDLARFATGKIEVSSLTVENYISTENMLENRSGISRATSLPTVATVPTFNSGYVLISNIRPYFKKIWFASFDGGRSNDVLCFETKEVGCQEFLYNLLYQDEFFGFMMRTSKGAKMPRGDKDAIAGWTFPCANQELRSVFSEKVRPFYLYIENLNVESRHLSTIRDTLLPKLLSGALQVAPNFISNTNQKFSLRSAKCN